MKTSGSKTLLVLLLLVMFLAISSAMAKPAQPQQVAVTETTPTVWALGSLIETPTPDYAPFERAFTRMVEEKFASGSVDTTAELEASGLTGRAYEILKTKISEKEAQEAAARAAARKKAAAQIARAATSSQPAPVPASSTTVTQTGGIRVTATGYCSCSTCCGKSNGITASGAQASWGTIAAPRGWAFGSQFNVEGFGETVFTVQDRGGAISGNRIDIWFASHQQALNWGRRTVTLYPR